MILQNRIIWNDNGTLTDQSGTLNTPTDSAITFNYTTAQDYLYIGGLVPFNHRYFKVGTANAVASAVTVELWDGDSWVSAVDVIDTTKSSGGASLNASGYISWRKNKNLVWSVDDTDQMDGSGLENLTIYDLYWVRLSFSATFTSSMTIGYVGHKFSDDNDLGVLYPELVTSSMKSAFQSGLTSYDSQHIAAAEEVIRVLQTKNIIWSGDEVLEWNAFSQSACHQVAKIIYTAFGDDYKDNRETAIKDFKESMDKHVFPTDRNRNTRLENSDLMQEFTVKRR